MSLKIRCTRATDGSPMFLLSVALGNSVPNVYAMSRESTEDLVQKVTSAVRSYDNTQKNTPTPTSDPEVA